MALTALILLASIVCLSNGAMVVEKDRVCFSSTDEGLAWPLPNIKNPGILISHVAHCFKVALKPVSSGAETGEHLHHEHCVQLVNKTLDFINTNGFKVDTWICNALRQSYSWNQRQWDGGIWGRWSNPSVHSNRDKRGSSHNHAENVGDKTGEDQNSAFTNLASSNFGKYLIASISDPNSLSEAEKKYVRVWEDDQAITLGALGLYCYVQGDLSAISGALNL